MKIFLVGDYTSGTGPANVTKHLLDVLPKDTLRLRTWNKITRTFEILRKMKKADICLISGYSKQNVLALRWAKVLNKPSCYLMHGCVEHENEINGVPDALMNRIERETLRLSDRILGVSMQFAEWLKTYYPEHADKVGYLTNGIDWKCMKERPTGVERDANRILSVGGGMPRKRIVKICEAIGRLNDRGYDLTLSVAGDTGKDTEKIRSYPFVRDHGLLGKKDMEALYCSSGIFIQNSCFETFGLAPLEALLCDCDVLLSRHVGALSVLSGTEPEDVIEDCENVQEIEEKIEHLLENGNHTRLLVELDKESTSWEARASELQTILRQIKEKKL